MNDNASYEIVENTLSIIPVLNNTLPIHVTLLVSDGVFSDSGVFTIEIIPINDAPVITSVPSYNIEVNELFEYTIEIDDPDNDDFLFTIENEPDGMVLNENGIITWIPTVTESYPGIIITVTDTDQDNPLSDSQEFSLDVRLAQSFSLSIGSNLISYLGVLQDNTIENMLLPLSGNITQISTENSASIQLEDGSWIGSLDYIEPTKGYWIRLNEGTDYGVSTYQTPIDQNYSLHLGWNLISYIGDDAVALDDALPDDVELYFTDIISENMVAVRDEDGQWLGSLANVGWHQLEGYWVNVSDSLTFNFDTTDNLSLLINNEIVNYRINNVIQEFKYTQSQSQSFYYFKEVEINNSTITEDDWLIAYYNGVVIGARQWFGSNTDVPAMGFDSYNETASYAVDNSKINFKVYQQSTGKLIDMHGDIPRWKNQSIFMVDRLQEKMTLPENYSIDLPYPNPFNPMVNMKFTIPVEDHVKIIVYDLQGRIIDKLIDNTMKPGFYKIEWNAENFASGIYFMHLSSGEFVSTQKITLLK